jgi:hypothetical protein
VNASTPSSSGAIEPTSVQTGAEAGSSNAPVPAPDSAPQRTGWASAIAGILNFVRLSARVMALAAAAALLKEQLHLLKAHMHRNAARARRLSEHLHQAGADIRFQGQAIEVSQAFDRVAEASGQVADAADKMEANARGVRDAHQTEYGGIYEVAQASPYTQPKPGFTPAR